MEAAERVGETLFRGQRAEARRERGRFHRDVRARQRAPRVAFEHRATGPGRDPTRQHVDELDQAGAVPVGFAIGDDLLAEEVDGRGFAVVPQARQARERSRRRCAGDELARHAGHAASRHRRGHHRAERHVLRDVDAEVERARDRHTLEVLVEVADHLVVVAARRQDVDEPEQLRLELRVRHRPVEHALAPPPEVEGAGAFAPTSLGEILDERPNPRLERRRESHRCHSDVSRGRCRAGPEEPTGGDVAQCRTSSSPTRVRTSRSYAACTRR